MGKVVGCRPQRYNEPEVDEAGGRRSLRQIVVSLFSVFRGRGVARVHGSKPGSDSFGVDASIHRIHVDYDYGSTR